MVYSSTFSAAAFLAAGRFAVLESDGAAALEAELERLKPAELLVPEDHAREIAVYSGDCVDAFPNPYGIRYVIYFHAIALAAMGLILLDIPAPQHSQGVVRRDLLDDGRKYKPISIVGLNDFHGQLDPTTMLMDGVNVGVGGASRLGATISCPG